jgi:hypothetical protein
LPKSGFKKFGSAWRKSWTLSAKTQKCAPGWKPALRLLQGPPPQLKVKRSGFCQAKCFVSAKIAEQFFVSHHLAATFETVSPKIIYRLAQIATPVGGKKQNLSKPSLHFYRHFLDNNPR